jgi:hypothetical protein
MINKFLKNICYFGRLYALNFLSMFSSLSKFQRYVSILVLFLMFCAFSFLLVRVKHQEKLAQIKQEQLEKEEQERPRKIKGTRVVPNIHVSYMGEMIKNGEVWTLNGDGYIVVRSIRRRVNGRDWDNYVSDIRVSVSSNTKIELKTFDYLQDLLGKKVIVSGKLSDKDSIVAESIIENTDLLRK